MANDLIIPVYLNQRIVFDLLAMREGGISHVTRIASTEKAGTTDQRRYGAEFGLSKALSSLLSINVSGDRTKTGESGSSSSKDEERVHTPASLFYRLRSQLLADQDLVQLTSESSIEPHQLVEFDAELTRSPLLETIDSMTSLMEMASMFEDKPPQKGNPKTKPKSDNERILEQMRSFGEKLRSGDSVDVVADNIAGSHRALITLETEYLNDPSMADLVDGKFKVIGKVTRTVGGGESISLLRRSALSMMPQGILNQMLGVFESLSASDGFNVPSLQQDIEGPAFQILPLAIFA